MPATLHARLVNGRTGDPTLFVDLPFQRRALLFDLGDLHALSARELLRVEAVLVTHTHVDHFIGFDTLLRHLIGRERHVRLVGPAGFATRVYHRLHGYEWDLAARYAAELTFDVTEVAARGEEVVALPRTRYRFRGGFLPEALPPAEDEVGAGDRVVLRLGELAVAAVPLVHHGAPCLGYAVTEAARVNVWRNRLEARGLPVGPWLAGLKRAVLAGLPDTHPVPFDVRPRGAAGGAAGAPALPGALPPTLPPTLPLGELRDLVTVTPGQKLGYVTDVADTPANRVAIEALVRGADTLFIEAAFAAEDAPLAAARGHLTTRAAGEIAHAAGALRVEPFHFSPRYAGEEARLLAEVAAAFGGPPGDGPPGDGPPGDGPPGDGPPGDGPPGSGPTGERGPP
ncbi:MBL fold metallo-hydrolase [Roseomonas sp. NAR14]|uniref:MBL fold metallo-hydrolase n=1 Tax=Roseomonas acroporae TaxID=2937791 RepID=A0A9X1YCT8_9PROT|nr:MBL fold metallo-hydrolase [Roseomonas acroporae]MCK8787791.1 MBL fold metallo-hydrolase [Roseomonas acroporae]